MFKKSKVLTREYMQDYKSKRDKKVPRLEKKIRRILIRYINKGIKITIKYGEKESKYKNTFTERDIYDYDLLNWIAYGKVRKVLVEDTNNKTE